MAEKIQPDATINWRNRIYDGDTVEVSYNSPYAPAGFRGQVLRRYATSGFTMLEVRRADGATRDVPLVSVSKLAGVGLSRPNESTAAQVGLTS
ncbi:Uncharacterised protein [Mycobacteroides abscessus subsp. abscessus]|uniref:hypothetical protein n=1 Tax=Mycobacteroides abscessus TaxID=36809 RepID=UPI0009264546|nr:hypothetical protein [Mycobacteroides abscessus]SHX98341.1 Uncharacterised protein [Mycobacteroides abscessus subsp. abscessus]SIC79816.1 Uncharacterised protein [Mycobacteroides abscessus subsp. abscessus]SKK32763.1 Uncharacterised protein [Mycobacteroides abscessus subsp. abscessus]SKP26420.1 Uncharacterised protein [Mycobacteroides abscessus subsp. abscessus]